MKKTKAVEKKETKNTKAVVKHLKSDNKDCTAENKEHNKLIKRIKKK
tara:strand:+ start:159 stop:299 length:141 start_codon:yes stop_codon:yes gene_type:complete